MRDIRNCTVVLCACSLIGCRSPSVERQAGSAPTSEEPGSSSAQTLVTNHTVAAALPSSASRMPRVMNLATARRLAMQQNPGLDATLARVEAARARVRQARANLFPSVSLGLSASHKESIPVRGADPRLDRTSGDGSSQEVDPFESYAASVTINWEIFDGFERRYDTLRQAHRLATEEARALEAQRQLHRMIGQAYYAAMFAQERLRIAREDSLLNKQFLEATMHRRRAGLAMERDVLNFEVRLNEARLDELDAERALALSQSVLQHLVGIAHATNTTWLFPTGEVAIAESLMDFDSQYGLAVEHRPDLAAKNHEIQALENDINRVRSDGLPDVALRLQDGFVRRDGIDFTSSDRAMSADLALVWNAFDGGEADADIAERQALMRVAVSEREEMLRQISQEIRDIHIALGVIVRSLAIQNETVRMQVRIHELVTKRYEAGVETITVVNNVLTDVISAEVNLSVLRVALLANLENLRAATGVVLNDACE